MNTNTTPELGKVVEFRRTNFDHKKGRVVGNGWVTDKGVIEAVDTTGLCPVYTLRTGKHKVYRVRSSVTPPDAA